MKLIFIDIDGTLTPPGENIPPASAVQAIHDARKAGNKVFLCTGRNYDMLSPLLRYGFDGVVGSAGGYVVCGGQVLYDCPMTPVQRKTALDSLHRHGVFCTIEARDSSWGDSDLKDFLKGQSEGNSEIERWRKALASNLGIRPIEEYDGSPIYKVVIMCLKMDQLDEARSLLEDQFDFCIQEIPEHGCVNGELINRKFDKGKGVLRICRHLGVPVSDTVGFGDSMNDEAMIRVVGTSVCMGNGAQSLKEICDLVCPAVTSDGLAWAFDRLHLR